MSFLSPGALRILCERLRQVDAEGWTLEHDAQEHADGALAQVAAELCFSAASGEPLFDRWGLVEKHYDNPAKMLEIAGALCAAELDRIDPGRPKLAPLLEYLLTELDRQFLQANGDAANSGNMIDKSRRFGDVQSGIRNLFRFIEGPHES